jgi:hypothetical protein
MRRALTKQGLLVGLFLAFAALSEVTEAQSIAAPPGSGGNVGVGVADGRRFAVKAVTFQALDEWGWDWLGSEEVVFIFRTPRYAVSTVEYDNIDSDDEPETFKRRDECVEPAVDNDGESNHKWTCLDAGMPAPLQFSIEAWEQSGSWPFFSDCWADQFVNSDLRSPDYEYCAQLNRAALIGKVGVALTLADLNELGAPGQFFTRRLDLFGGCESSATGSPCTGPSAPHYVVVYKVQRLPDATSPPVDPNP